MQSWTMRTSAGAHLDEVFWSFSRVFLEEEMSNWPLISAF
jgi:hypothetical protein